MFIVVNELIDVANKAPSAAMWQTKGPAAIHDAMFRGELR